MREVKHVLRDGGSRPAEKVSTKEQRRPTSHSCFEPPQASLHAGCSIYQAVQYTQNDGTMMASGRSSIREGLPLKVQELSPLHHLRGFQYILKDDITIQPDSKELGDLESLYVLVSRQRRSYANLA